MDVYYPLVASLLILSIATALVLDGLVVSYAVGSVLVKVLKPALHRPRQTTP